MSRRLSLEAFFSGHVIVLAFQGFAGPPECPSATVNPKLDLTALRLFLKNIH
jgi:hypothetical protein